MKPKVYLVIVEFIVSMVGGFLLHQTHRVVERMPSGWERLASFVIGVSGTFPFIGLFWSRLGDEVKPSKRGFIAYLMGYMAVGAGVALGWVADSLKKDD